MKELRGVYAPIVTPFRHADGTVDHPWMGTHIDYLRNHEADGIVVCGTNGEAPSLNVAERMSALETALKVSGRLGVIAGTGAAALPDAITLTRHAFSCGADAVLVMPPFYYKRQSPSGIIAWYRRLIDAAVPAEGRLLLYHIPQLTAVPITIEIIEALIASHGEVIHGIKDSTGDEQQGRLMRSQLTGLRYFVGNDLLVAAACADGASGSITAAANVAPDLVASVQRAARVGQAESPAADRLCALRALLDRFPLQAATKAALELLANLPSTTVRPPQSELDQEGRSALFAALREWRSQT
jgi:4-hydroxy-tetrahydrodipicolinate synthase